MNENHRMHRCSGEDQRKAIELYSTRKRLARNGLTYLHLVAQLDGHCAAVQIIITPFTLPQFPRQLGFWPRYQYYVCHKEALTENTNHCIVQVVQSVVGAYFSLGDWKISNEDCEARYFDPSFHALEATCPIVAETLLERYVASAHAWEGSKETNCTAPVNNEANSRGPSLQENEAHQKQRKDTRAKRPTVVLSAGGLAAESLPAEDKERVIEILSKIRNGLKAVSKDPSRTPMPDGQYQPYEHYAVSLLSIAKKLKKDAQNSAWWVNFLAGCVSFASLSLPARSAQLEGNNAISEQSRSTVARWRSTAEFLSAVVTGLYPTWKDSAFLVLNALAAKNATLRVISDLGRGRLLRIANEVISHIKDERPEIPVQRLLRPASTVGLLLGFDYETMCDALRLPKIKEPDQALRTALPRKRTAELSQSSNKRSCVTDQQPPQYPSDTDAGVDGSICSEPTLDEQSAAQLLYQLQSQSGTSSSQMSSTNQVPTGSVELNATGVGSTEDSRSDKSNVPLSDLGISTLLPSATKVVVRLESDSVDRQDLCNQTNHGENDQAAPDLRRRSQIEVEHNDTVVEKSVLERPGFSLNENTRASQTTPSQFLSERAESTLPESRVDYDDGYGIDLNMNAYEGCDLENDMDLFQGYDIHRDI